MSNHIITVFLWEISYSSNDVTLYSLNKVRSYEKTKWYSRLFTINRADVLKAIKSKKKTAYQIRYTK